MNCVALHKCAIPLNWPTRSLRSAVRLHRQAKHNLGDPVTAVARIVANGGRQQFGVKHAGFGFDYFNSVPAADGVSIWIGEDLCPQRRLKQFQAGDVGAKLSKLIGGA